MSNYSINTQLSFFSKDFDFLERNLPYPNGMKITEQGFYLFVYLLKGTFKTNKQITFLNDLIARFYLTFQAERIESEIQIDIKEPYEAKQLAQSDQLLSLNNIEKYSLKSFGKSRDAVFWALKSWAISYIQHNNFLNYYEFEYWALKNFVNEKKSKSDIVCKTRSIFNYYEKRNFQIEKKQYERKTKNNEELKMTRIENCRKIKSNEEKQNLKKIENFLSGLYSFEYKKKNGNWNVSKIAKDLKMSRPTIYKALEILKIK